MPENEKGAPGPGAPFTTDVLQGDLSFPRALDFAQTGSEGRESGDGVEIARGQQVDIGLVPTMQQLSELLSIHITTCTKLIAALENEGVIERTRARIRILDAERLSQYGLEDNPLAY